MALIVYAVHLDMENAVTFWSVTDVATYEEGVKKLRQALINVKGTDDGDESEPSDTMQLLFFSSHASGNMLDPVDGVCQFV